MKLLITIILLATVLSATYAQGRVADSLKRLLNHANTDTARISIMREQSRHYCYELGKTDSAIMLMKQSVDVAKRKGLVKQQVQSLYLLSNQYRYSRKFEIFQKTIMEALALARKHRLRAEEVDILNHLSYGYYLMRKQDSAKLLIHQGLALAKQNKFIDLHIKLLETLAREIRGTKPDSARLLFLQALQIARTHNLPLLETNVLAELTYLYGGNRTDSALLFYNQAFEIAKNKGFTKENIWLLANRISIRENIFDKDSLWQNLQDGLLLAQQIDSKMDSIELLRSFSVTSEITGNYPAAMEMFLQLLEKCQQLDRQVEMADIMGHIANLYIEQQDYRQSLDYCYKAKAISESVDNINGQSFIGILNLMALNFAKLNRRDSAYFYVKEALKLANHIYSNAVPGNLYNDMGLVYCELAQYERALDLFRRSYADMSNISDPFNFCITTLGLAQVFKMMGQQDSSVYYAHQTLGVAQENGLLIYTVNSGNLLMDYYKSKQIIDSAFLYQQIAIAAKDSLFNLENQRQLYNITFARQLQQKEVEQQVEKTRLQYRNQLRMYLLLAGLAVVLLIAGILWRNNRNRQKAYALLQRQKDKTDEALAELKATQAQLIQREKMASLGELTAGIAHEIQNPLNFVNNFSEVNLELIEDISKVAEDKEVLILAAELKENEQRIFMHGKRADAIVKSMMEHSRGGTGQKEFINLNALIVEHMHLAFHGMRVKDNTFNAKLETYLDKDLGLVNVYPQDMGRVLLNLFNNAFYSVNQKKTIHHETYEPLVTVSTKRTDTKIYITIRDNGVGVSQKIVDKIFQPFFTTKPTGQGTGLGLSLSYDIITKEHGGELKIDTVEGEYAEFTIQLPVQQ